MVDFSKQKATFSPIKLPHGLIYSAGHSLALWTLISCLSKMDTHLGGAVSTLGHVRSDEHAHELYSVFCCS